MRITGELVRRGLTRPVGVGVRYVEDVGETPPPLLGEEQDVLGPRAVAQRRMLFALGRAAARDAMAELGQEPVAIGRGRDGAPIWPDGILGAISHTGDVAMAVAGRRSDYVGLGLDVEELGRGIREDIARLVCRPAEMGWVDPSSGTDRLLMLFSAKESIFKALYPIERVWLGFSDAELTWDDSRGVFMARVLKQFGEGYPLGFEMEVNCSVIPGEWVMTTAGLLA